MAADLLAMCARYPPLATFPSPGKSWLSCERPRMIQPVAQQSPALASDAARPTWQGVQKVPPRHEWRSSKQSKRLEVYARLSGCIILVWIPRVSPIGHSGG